MGRPNLGFLKSRTRRGPGKRHRIRGKRNGTEPTPRQRNPGARMMMKRQKFERLLAPLLSGFLVFFRLPPSYREKDNGERRWRYRFEGPFPRLSRKRRHISPSVRSPQKERSPRSLILFLLSLALFFKWTEMRILFTPFVFLRSRPKT